MSYSNWALAERTAPQAIVDWPEYAEPYGVTPAQHRPAQHYGGVPPQYAVAPPFYGAPAQVRRPGTVIAAAVLAFVFGGLGTLVCLFYLLLAGIFTAAYHAKPWAPLMAIVYGALLLALAFNALFIWGGVRALKGRKTMLMVMSTLQVVLAALEFVGTLVMTSAPGASIVRSLPGLVFVVPILILLTVRSSREFFRARRTI